MNSRYKNIPRLQNDMTRPNPVCSRLLAPINISIT